MKFDVREKKGVVIVLLEGDMLGGPDATLLSEKFREFIGDGKNKIVVDMEKVNWMNSSGLGILIGGLTTVRNSGGDLRLLYLNDKARELLRITKLSRVFETFDDEDKAIDSFT